MTLHEEWTDKLSEYLDGELSPEETAVVQAHLRSCAACTAVLNDLKRIVARAQSVESRPPQTDLWAGVAARIDRVAQPRRFSFTLGQLAGAAVVLIAISAGAAWQLAVQSASRSAEAPPSMAQPTGTERALSAAPADHDRTEREPSGERTDRVVPVSLGEAQFDAAVADLEKALKAGRGRLDASTIAIVEHNLQIIDQAIAQARDALSMDPANSYLSGHLVEARRRKLDLLRRAAALAESN